MLLSLQTHFSDKSSKHLRQNMAVFQSTTTNFIDWSSLEANSQSASYEIPHLF
jgi:hypothetical protein